MIAILVGLSGMGNLSIVHGPLSIERPLRQRCRIGGMWRAAAGGSGRSVGDRPWIARGAFEGRADDPPIEPWPEALGKVALPEVSFERYPGGSLLPEIALWIQHEAQVPVQINWPALARVGVDQRATMK